MYKIVGNVFELTEILWHFNYLHFSSDFENEPLKFYIIINYIEIISKHKNSGKYIVYKVALHNIYFNINVQENYLKNK